MMSKTLWIAGDSYSFAFDHDRVWTSRLSKKLNYGLKNLSIFGCSQDYICQMIGEHAHEISRDDQIVIVLTSSNRFWFFEDRPDVTNPSMLDPGKLVGKDRAKVTEMYFRYIQRPQLDILHVTMRLAWLNHMTVLYGWQSPLIIFGFPQSILSNCVAYPNLIFSHGNLTENVSIPELENDDPAVNLFNGEDPRYNHMCLKNHDVLSNKVYSTLVDNQKLDLTEGFYTKIMSKKMLHNPTFVNEELWLESYEKFKNGYK